MANQKQAGPGTSKTNSTTTSIGRLDQKLCFDRPISDVYTVIDNDLARDNLENDLTEADLQDL